MSKFSDHKKPQIDISQYLPEVYRSEVNKGVFQNAFNRLLTKDDTQRVAGFIGEGNPQALRNRQIVEETPHRQAYQLAPTMYTQVGTVENALSFSAFQQQLELMGVDMDRFAKWGDTVQFNWIPPVNLDMLVNYADYFWSPSNAKDQPQYMTVENRCHKSQSKINAYRNIMRQRGSTFEVIGINFVDNSFDIQFKNDDLFTDGFVFSTKQSSNSNLNSKFWTVASSSFSTDTNRTTIVVVEPIIPVSAAAPTTPERGDWWYDTTFQTIKTWSGTEWVVTSAAITVSISLEELAIVYQAESNCICNQDTGWDVMPWDDNQIGNVVWNESLITCISHPTEASWVAANHNTACHTNLAGNPTAAPAAWDLWYDITADILKQRNASNSSWLTVVQNFSTVLSQTKGSARWDQSDDCDAQVMNQWSNQNEWIHKSEVQAFTGIKRAQMPILEYSSTTEMNAWVKDTYGWKYRTELGETFEPSSSTPHRFELEPIFGFVVSLVNDTWRIYLFDRTNVVDCNVDYTDTFGPGYQFRVMDDIALSDVYTVKTATYREPRSTDPASVQGKYMLTVVEIEETVFTSPLIGGGANNVRMVPQQTSLGDVWRGYHAHWVMDTTSFNSIPCAHQSVPLFKRYDDAVLITTPAAVSQGMVVMGDAYQELTIQVDNNHTVNLPTKFRFNPSYAHLFATPNSGMLRVYLNGIRQYGTYTEIVATATPSMCVVGYSVWDSQKVEYVSGVRFNDPLNRNDVVRFEVGPSAQSDLGMGCVPVRTVEDEGEFVAACIEGTQPVYMSVAEYRRVEQIKTTINQYPMFNVYDVITGDVVKATNIFGYAESSEYSINSQVQRRIVMDATSKEYTFEQNLQDESDGLLYGYRIVSNVVQPNGTVPEQWWYNPYTDKLQGWDGNAWTSTILTPGASNSHISRTVLVQSTEPTELNVLENALWYNPISNTLYQRNVVGGTWVNIATPTVGGDPTLTTIWRCGDAADRLIPQYVDDSRNPTTIGSPAGSWQVPAQWMYNPEHKNHSTVRLSDLVTHFSTIIQSQPELPGFLNGGRFILTHDNYDYGTGGTIKEHNYSFDTLISAVNVSNTTPVGVLEFAQKEYASSLQFVNDLFVKHVIDALSSHDLDSVTMFEQYVIAQILDKYQSNEFMSQVYSDTSAYDGNTNTGIKNWIATAPMFGLVERTNPYVLVSGNMVEIKHHDGHRSSVNFSAAEQDYISRLITNSADARTTSGKRGVISSTTPPATMSAMVAAFKPDAVDSHESLIPGVFWYRLGAGTRALYRFQCYTVTAAAPPMTDINGTLPDGTQYYNTVTDTVYVKSGDDWVAATVPGSGDVSPLWVIVDFKEILANMILEIENQLYNVTPAFTNLVFDHTTLVTDTADQAAYDRLYRDRFTSYVNELNIVAPMVNSSYIATNAFTWNYIDCAITDAPTADEPVSAGCWQQLYTNLYSTPYPHLEPWCLQGYKSKPTWWDEEYQDNVTSRRWKYNHATATGMWENIRIGRVPAGRPYPNGRISTGNPVFDQANLKTYAYFSVNISDAPIAGGYAPDAVLPPYYDNTAISASLPSVRSVFTRFSSEITSPDADYAFGDGGPIEWKWTTSMQYVYDKLIIAFLMQPVRFMHSTFGPTFTDINHLQVEATFGKVYSHDNALFHGDLYNTNQTYHVRGLNQWYVNRNRYTGFDTNTQFRQEWAGWTPRLTYQFGGIIDISSFDISTKYFDINKQDFGVSLINNGVVTDAWVDAFNVSLLSMPPAIVQYNNQSLWKFEIDTLASIPRSIQYYGVKSYAVDIPVGSNEIRVMRYRPTAVQAIAKRFFFAGDQSQAFVPQRQFVMSGSTFNNGTYTIVSSLYEPTLDRTRVTVYESVPSNAIDGVADMQGVAASWDTGDMVVLTSTKTLPHPLQPDTPYYVIKIGTNTYQLADTFTDAIAGESITVTSGGLGAFTASSVKSSFRTFGGAGNSGEVWYHYELDTSVVRTLSPPSTVQGFQSLVNIIDGYAAHQDQYNIKYGVVDTSDFDPVTGRIVDWQLETERCIEWAYGLRRSQINISDRYQVSANVTDNTFAFVDSAPMWMNGTRIAFTTSGTLPSPLIANTPYYVVTTEVDGVFKVSITANALDTNMIVDLTSSGSGTIMVGLYDRNLSYPSFELNPIRNNIWIETPYGVLADVIQGPYTDIRVQQTIFDQYGRPIPSDKLTVFREDGRSNVMMRSGVPNDINPSSLDDVYNYIHFGGSHLFVEGYEHFLLFNNYTASGDLIYDAFLGLSVKKFNIDYDEKQDYSLRPTLGGFYLVDGEFKRNIEGSITDMRNFYDATGMNEATDMAQHAHALIGYQGPTDYLNLLNINSKSQFAFYRGMLQTKGSVNSIKAYINSRRFVDAKMDEFWAWKIAEYGDSRPRIYPEIKLLATDGLKDDIRLLFSSAYETASADSFESELAKGFQEVSFAVPDRWVDFPEQRDAITSPLFLDAEITSISVVYVNDLAPTVDEINDIGITHWFTGEVLYVWVDGTWVKSAHRMAVNDTHVYWKHDGICDAVRVIRRTFIATSAQYPIVGIDTIEKTIEITGNHLLDFDIGSQIKIVESTNNNRVYTIVSVEADASSTRIGVAEYLLDSADGSVYVENRTLGDMATLNLTEGTGVDEFVRINAEIVRFAKTGFSNVMNIFTLNPAKSRISPAKLVDKGTHTVVHDIPLWHPALGYHYPNAMHGVDVFADADPALYSFTRNANDVSLQPWNDTETGKVWLDTSKLGYVPYYDDVLYPNTNDRLYSWGNLADWASVEAYQWVTSTTPPSAWDAAVTADANNTTKLQSEKATGTARKTVFVRRRTPVTATIVNSQIVASLAVLAGDQVLFTVGEGEKLPTALADSTKYVVDNVTSELDVYTFDLLDPDTRQRIVVANDGDGTLTIVPAFKSTDWKINNQLHLHLFGALDLGATSINVDDPVIALGDGWYVGDTVNCYINGLFTATTTATASDDGSVVAAFVDQGITISERDIVDIICVEHIVTDADSEFDPDSDDDGTQMVQWVEDYQYTTHVETTGNTTIGILNQTYYSFWVKNTTTRNSRSDAMSAADIASTMVKVPVPHMVVMMPLDDTTWVEKYGYGVNQFGSIYSLGDVTEAYHLTSVLYREAVIRNAASYILDDDRFVVRFMRDVSLRDRIQPNPAYAKSKNKHEEWYLFRREQSSTVPAALWKRLTEAMMGQKYDDSTVRVPSLERELYDMTHDTDTRFGLGDKQAFVDKTLAMNTVIEYLQRPTNNFYPADIDDFFNRNTFSSPAGIKAAMDEIYNTFPATHVNNIWFDALLDALSTRSKYKEIMKTSWIALHGIRVLEVGGLFDD